MFRTLLFILLLLMSCKENKKTGGAPNQQPQGVHVKIIPLGNINNRSIDTVFARIKDILPKTELLAHEPLPENTYYKPRNRYRADSIISILSGRAGKDEVWLGITSEDISTTKNNNPDSGIMGLGYQPGNACVISDYRLRNKNSIFKIAVHELGHTTGLPHCPQINCYMRDAKGGNPTDEETGFCTSCKKHLVAKGWHL